MKKIFAMVALIAIGGIGVIGYQYFHDDPPKRLAAVGCAPAGVAKQLAGKYTVTKGAGTVAGFRINEEILALSHTAVVRTSEVSGTMSVAAARVTGVDLTVDMTKLESKDTAPKGIPAIGNRLKFIRDSGLETDKFPTSKFTAASIDLGTAAARGKSIKTTAAGQLTIHGVTKPVSIPVTACWTGSAISVSGSLDVKLADYGIDPPDVGFAKVTKTGTIEFNVAMQKA